MNFNRLFQLGGDALEGASDLVKKPKKKELDLIAAAKGILSKSGATAEEAIRLPKKGELDLIDSAKGVLQQSAERPRIAAVPNSGTLPNTPNMGLDPITGDQQWGQVMPTQVPGGEELDPITGDVRWGQPGEAPIPQTGPLGDTPAPAGIMEPSLQDQIEAVQNKDYSKGGADRDDDFDWKDVLIGAGIGFMEGGVPGAIMGGADKHTLEKFKDRQELQKLMGAQGQRQKQEGIDLQNQQRAGQIDLTEARIEDIGRDNDRADTQVTLAEKNARADRKLREQQIIAEKRTRLALEKSRQAHARNMERVKYLNQKDLAERTAKEKRELTKLQGDIKQHQIRLETSARQKLENLKAINAKIASTQDFEQKQMLQQQAEAAKQELATLRGEIEKSQYE